MYNITSKQDLEKVILLIENEVEEQKDLLTDQIRLVYKSFMPVNVIKDVFNEIVISKELRSNIFKAAIGILTGYFAKKIFFRKNATPLKRFLGNLLQYGIANSIINPSSILNAILAPFQEFFDSK